MATIHLYGGPANGQTVQVRDAHPIFLWAVAPEISSAYYMGEDYDSRLDRMPQIEVVEYERGGRWGNNYDYHFRGRR